MKNIEKNYQDHGNKPLDNPIGKHTENVKQLVGNTLRDKMSSDLEMVFWMKAKEKNWLQNAFRIERNNLSDENEVNSMEAELAAFFWKDIYEKMLHINTKPTLSMEAVLSRFDVLKAA